MAKVTVMLYTTLRAKLGISRVEIEGSSVKDVIDKLKEIKSDVAKILLDENGDVKNYFVLTLNSKILDNKSIRDIKVKDKDILHIFPPISGG